MNHAFNQSRTAHVTAIATLISIAGLAHSAWAQPVPAVRMMPLMRAAEPVQPVEPGDDALPGEGAAPAQPGDAAAPKPPALPKEEIAELKEIYASLSPQEKEEMKATYLGMGVDLATILSDEAKGPSPMPVADAIRNMDFARTPRAVLAARSQLGFNQTPEPDYKLAKPQDLAKFFHLHTMAGDWESFAKFLAARPVPEAEGIFAHVLQSMNKGDPGLLPEEVLAIADAAPGEVKDWQIEAVARLLQSAAAKNSTGPMLTQLKAGTRLFGGTDPANRERAVTLLAGAGMVLDAYEYLPPLEEAHSKKDAAVILVHGRYHADLATSMSGPEADDQRTAAWDLFCEASLIDNASVALRKDAMTRAIDLLPFVPPAQSRDWFNQIFANASLGPAALEIIAIKGSAIRDAKLDVEQRARTILTMKEAVDTLIGQENVDIRTLRIPLRMLTTALVGEAEVAIQDKGRQRIVARETELLLRALPGDKWLDAIEPSLATRASRAAMAVATVADKQDQAMEILKSALKRAPDQGEELGDWFLQNWEKRLNPTSQPDDYEDRYFFFGYRDQMSAAPVTRGRQRRNLQRLHDVIEVLKSTGVEPRKLPSITAVFKACHSRTECFAREDIIRVFGPLDQIPAPTAAALADTMRQSLATDWRSREVQRENGMNRTNAEIVAMVEKGYALALELTDRALAADPDSWHFAITKAVLSYERMQFKQTNQRQEFAKYDAYRKEAFESFQAAAQTYARLVAKGEQRDDAGVFRAWFAAALNTTELNYLNREDKALNDARQSDQVDLIKAAIMSLPADAADRHLSAFARAIEAEVGSAPPEVKPRLVRHALRIVGDHPAGAGLRGLNELYQDLVKDEIKLRMTLDGADKVGVGKPFGVMLSLRFTTAVDRETGGFTKYLQNDVYGRVGNSWKSMNYKDQLKKNIEESLLKDFDVESVGFFEPFTPTRAVSEGGQDGWEEKPMAYVTVKRKDPSVDRLPQVTMDMYFNDPTGSVTLSLPSNSPPIATGTDITPRPVKGLEVTQVIDLRRAETGDKDKAITIEIMAKGRGIMPELPDLITGLENSLPGYAIAENGIETRPVSIHEDDAAPRSRMFFYGGSTEPPKGGYPEADENGIFRIQLERSWVITMKPTGSTVAGAMTVPTLKPGIDAKLNTKRYADMDVIPVSEATISIHPRILTPFRLLVGGLALVAVVTGLIFWARRRRNPAALVHSGMHMPGRITPLSVVTTLRRYQTEHAAALNPANSAELEQEITTLERRYFGPGAVQANGELNDVLNRWSNLLARD